MVVQRINNKGLQFVNAFYAVIVISMMIISVQFILNGWSDAYGTSVNEDLGDFDKLDEISLDASKQKDAIGVKDVGQGEAFEDTTFRGVFGVINNIFEPFNIVFGNNGMIDAITERFGLPDYIRQGIVTIMIFSIIFAIIAIIFRLPGGKT